MNAGRAVLIVASLCWGAAVSIASGGGITWEAPIQELEIEAGAKSVPVVFRFRNDGDTPVTFGLVSPSCGCTVGELPRQTWAPGETGELTARIRLAQYETHKTVTLRVGYDEPKGSGPDLLKFTVHTQPWGECTPRLLWWRQGQSAEAKTFTVTFAPGFETSSVEIFGEGEPSFTIQPFERKDGIATFSVAPSTTDAPQSQQLHLRLVRPDGRVVERTVFLRVM